MSVGCTGSRQSSRLPLPTSESIDFRVDRPSHARRRGPEAEPARRPHAKGGKHASSRRRCASESFVQVIYPSWRARQRPPRLGSRPWAERTLRDHGDRKPSRHVHDRNSKGNQAKRTVRLDRPTMTRTRRRSAWRDARFKGGADSDLRRADSEIESDTRHTVVCPSHRSRSLF